MKTELRKYLSSGERLRINNDLNGISSVKAGKGLINWLIKLVDIISKERKPSWTRSSVVFIRHYWRLRQQMGPKGTVLYLKACYVLTMQAAGGMVIPSTQSLGIAVSRAHDGLPRIIPRVQRGLIRGGNRKALRIWLSWFSLYRVISFPSVAKLSTITDPGKVLSVSLKSEVEALMPSIQNLWNSDWTFSRSLGHPELKMLYKSSPTVSGLDSKRMKVWKYSSSLLGLEQGAVSLFHSDVWSSFVKVHEWLSEWSDYQSTGFLQMISNIARSSSMQPTFIGRLGLKQEAAGKVRVFAMVDAWTQFLLQPLHAAIFKLLKTFPTDGTFDQTAPIERLMKMGKTKFWCFDLSAATDRLPVVIQAVLLNNLVGTGFGNAWMQLLVGRAYQVPDSVLLLKKDRMTVSVKYAVGQPMGALSSWGMLALTHHFLVMMAAKRAGFPAGTFTSYAVLGDDIVIANGPVAQQYLHVLSDVGVKVGLAKSLVSKKGALEFAKRFFILGEDCSPVALKEVAAAISNPTFGVAFMKKFELMIPTMLSVLGFGYRVKARLSGYLGGLPSRVQSLGIAFFSPWGLVPLDVLIWLQLDGFNPSSIIKPVYRDWRGDAREQLQLLVDETCEKKWPWYLENNDILRLKDLKVPPKSRWSTYNDDKFGVYGLEPMGDLNLFNSLQAAVYKELMVQRLDLKELNTLSMDFKWRPGDLSDDIIKYVELEKALRLFRTPKQIVHADSKSNKIGLAFQMKLWRRFQLFLETGSNGEDKGETEERGTS